VVRKEKTRGPRNRGPFLLLLLLFSCGGEDEPPPGRTFAEKVESPIENVAKIADGIYRGGQPDEEGYAWLKEQGFKTIISFRSHHPEKEKVEKHGMRAVAIPITAELGDSEPPTAAQVKQFFDVLLDPQQRPVYFHCSRGSDRTGAMAALYRLEMDGWTNKEAIAEMKHFGYFEGFKDLMKFVETYFPKGFQKE